MASLTVPAALFSWLVALSSGTAIDNQTLGATKLDPDYTTETPIEGSTAVADVDADGNTTIDGDALDDALATIDPSDIDEDELAGLLLMREEEKLARDVYQALFDIHGDNIFSNIASSEQTHTDAMLTLLDRYGIEDPVGTNDYGVFTNTDLQMLYDQLVALGSASLMDALFVGAAIEELDISDIVRLQEQVTGNDDIVLVYDNLLLGSRNHLRSFDKKIKQNGWVYEPQYITQEAYDAIVNSDMETGGK